MTVATTRTPTDRQLAVLRHLLEFTMEHGYQPSYRETCGHFGWSSAHTMNGYLGCLARAGYVEVRGPDGQGAPGRAVRILRLPDGTPFRGFMLK